MSYIQELRALTGHRPLILVSALVLIFDRQHRLLLQHRTEDDMWDLPGGFMELGESAEETARREIREETGLEIGKMALATVLSGQEFFYECPNGDQVFSVSCVYVTNDVQGEPRPDGQEGTDLQYFPVGNLPSKMHPEIRMAIEDFLQARGM